MNIKKGVRCCAMPGKIVLCQKPCLHLEEGGLWEECGNAILITADAFESPALYFDEWVSHIENPEK